MREKSACSPRCPREVRRAHREKYDHGGSCDSLRGTIKEANELLSIMNLVNLMKNLIKVWLMILLEKQSLKSKGMHLI